MPSYRYLRDNPPEGNKYEAPPEYTKKEKAANWWHYHWRWVAGALAVVLLVGWAVGSIVTRVEPDIVLGIVTSDMLPDEMVQAMELELSKLVEDYNGDGKHVVSVQVFQLSYVPEMAEREDPQMRMAAVTRFTVAVGEAEPLIFLLQKTQGQAQALQDEIHLLGNADGSVASNNADVEDLGAAWEKTAFAKMSLAFSDDNGDEVDGKIHFSTYQLGMRPFEGTSLSENKKGQQIWQTAFDFYENLRSL